MARYYRVGFGRFCSPDPLGGNPGDPQSWNRYVYARDNPINNVDPSGMSWFSSFIHALVSFFTDVNFGPGGTPPTFPTGNYDVWQKLEDAIIPPMMGGGTPPFLGLVAAGTDAGTTSIADALGPCVKDLFGVTLVSFTPSQKGSGNTPSSNGSFTGTKPGVYQGADSPDAKGPDDFTVANDVSKNSDELLAMGKADGANTDIPPGQHVQGYTPQRDPLHNYTASNDDASNFLPTQIFELGNSLSFITHKLSKTKDIKPGTEPLANALLDCYTRKTSQ
jgi:hypothetical protein